MTEKERLEYLHSLVSVLPEQPGVYQYFDSTGKIIYVGKAKNLKRRLSSYFNRTQTGKTKILVDNNNNRITENDVKIFNNPEKILTEAKNILSSSNFILLYELYINHYHKLNH